MPKRLPPNNRPWPENMAFDFSLSPSLSPTDAEAFIDSLLTTERNKAFLRLRYKAGRQYNEIADEYGITASGVRLAVKTMWKRFSAATPSPATSTALAPPASPVPPPPPPVANVAPQSAATPSTTPAAPAPATTPSPVPMVKKMAPQSAATEARPLALNLASVRRFLGLTVEEFARPISIEDGESLITRLETGFSKASGEVIDLICEAWGISRSYLLTGQGEMFDPGTDYCDGLVRLLRRYLPVATMDTRGNQYWKGCLVDDLGRLIDVGQLSGREMCRVVRVLFDYLDVDAFEALLDRMGRG